MRLISMRHEFPDAWARFKGSPASQTDRFQLSLPLSAQLYPFWSRGVLGSVRDLGLLALPSAGAPAGNHDTVFKMLDRKDLSVLAKLLSDHDPAFGNLCHGGLAKADLPATPGSGAVNLSFEGNQFDDLWIAITWGP